MKRNLHGQCAIITGASRGIGRAIAGRLSGAGMTVGIMARSESLLEEVRAGIEAGGGKAIVAVCDLKDTEALPETLRELTVRLGRVDCLINNAGAFLESPMAGIGTRAWQDTLAVNLTAPFLCCRELIPHFLENERGHIVNIASTAASQGYLNQSAYCASKHGLLGMSRALAIELKPHRIRVSCVSPGGVNTDFITGTHLAERLEGQTKIEPDDVAAWVQHVLEAPDNVETPEVILRRYSPT